jgi:hypothetical protein
LVLDVQPAPAELRAEAGVARTTGCTAVAPVEHGATLSNRADVIEGRGVTRADAGEPDFTPTVGICDDLTTE